MLCEACLYRLLRPFFWSNGFQKSEIFGPFLRRFLALLKKYSANSQVRFLSAKPGFENLLYFAGHDLFWAEKYYRFRKVNILNFDRFKEIFWVFLKTTLSYLRWKIHLIEAAAQVFSAASATPLLFVGEKFDLWENKTLTLLASFSRETLKVVGQSPIFENKHFVPNLYNKFKKHQIRTTSLSWGLDMSAQDLQKFWFT